MVAWRASVHVRAVAFGVMALGLNVVVGGCNSGAFAWRHSDPRGCGNVPRRLCAVWLCGSGVVVPWREYTKYIRLCIECVYTALLVRPRRYSYGGWQLVSYLHTA